MACKTIHEQDVFDTYRSAYKIKFDYSKFIDGKTLMNSGAQDIRSMFKQNVLIQNRPVGEWTCWRVNMLACGVVDKRYAL